MSHYDILAREVISKAIELRYAGMTGDLNDFDAVIAGRWPCRGTGGVAMSQRQTVAKVRAAINEFYIPSEMPERNA
jgi:hypothetical protein